jgi:hypothetical protein
MTIRMLSLTRFAVALLLAGAVILFIALYAGPIGAVAAHADGNRCGARGTYGYTGFGTVFPNNGYFPPGIASTNGTITLDGKGNVLIHEVEVIEGAVVSPPEGSTFVGTYTLNPDCTFTGTLTQPPVPGTALVGVAVDDGKGIRAMLTVPGVQINFVSTTKVHPERSSK